MSFTFKIEQTVNIYENLLNNNNNICHISHISHIRSGHCQHDCWQRCLRSFPGCRQLHANGQFGIEEIGLFVFDELCQISTGHGYYGGQHICQGSCYYNSQFYSSFSLIFLSTLSPKFVSFCFHSF